MKLTFIKPIGKNKAGFEQLGLDDGSNVADTATIHMFPPYNPDDLDPGAWCDPEIRLFRQFIQPGTSKEWLSHYDHWCDRCGAFLVEKGYANAGSAT